MPWEDIKTAGKLLKEVFGAASPPLYASGTNDCDRNSNSDTMAALVETAKETGIETGFSFHSYPGDGLAKDITGDMRKYVLNTTWLRSGVLQATAACVDEWNSGPRGEGIPIAITEGSSASGATDPGTPGSNSFTESIFSIAQLGQFARAGATLLGRWSITNLLGSGGAWTVADVAADFFLYAIYNKTVGPGVLSVKGDEATEALVYAQCAVSQEFGKNGTVTVFATNPSSAPVTLQYSIPTLPRFEYVLTAPNNDPSATTPVLNGDTASPLRLESDGSLPRMDPVFCGQIGCHETITLPPLSYGFFVLLEAGAAVCK